MKKILSESNQRLQFLNILSILHLLIIFIIYYSFPIHFMEFAKWRAMCAMRSSVVYMPTCHRAKSVPNSHFYVKTYQ